MIKMTLLYLAAILMSALKVFTLWQEEKDTDLALRGNMSVYTAILIALGLVRISHFDVHFVEQFRTFLELYGWYEDRRPLQVLLITIVLIPASIILIMELRRSQSRAKGNLGVALATYALLCLILVSLISFHYIDFILMQAVGQITLVTLLEAGSLIEIMLSHLPGFRMVAVK